MPPVSQTIYCCWIRNGVSGDLWKALRAGISQLFSGPRGFEIIKLVRDKLVDITLLLRSLIYPGTRAFYLIDFPSPNVYCDKFDVAWLVASTEARKATKKRPKDPEAEQTALTMEDKPRSLLTT